MSTKKQPEYMARFINPDHALEKMRMKNRTNRVRGWIWVLIDGPDNDYFVMDIRSAIENGMLYRWA